MNKEEFDKYLGTLKYREDGMTLDIPYEKFDEAIKTVAEKCDYDVLCLILMGIGIESICCAKETMCEDFANAVYNHIECKVRVGKQKLDAINARAEKHRQAEERRREYQRQYREKKKAGKAEYAQFPVLLKAFENIKKKHPDALLLMRTKDNKAYYMFKEDAKKYAEVMKQMQKQTSDGLQYTSFKYNELDDRLPKLIRAGCRIVICDYMPLKKSKHN